MKLIENKKPNFVKPQFLCDECISEKLNEFPLVRDNMNKYHTSLFIGKQGSGKTSLILNFLNKLFKKKFEYIYVFMPYTSRRSIKNNIFDKHLPEDQIYEELTEESVNELYENLKRNSNDGHKTLVIYDDVQKALKNDAVIKQLKNIVANQRHLKVVNWIILQNYFALDNKIRELVNNIFLFKLSKTQMNKIFNECIETHKNKFDDIIKFVYNKPHEWMFINIGEQKIYKNFDEIIMDDDDDLENV